MPALQFILTTAGKAAIVAANNAGTNPVVVDRVAIGTAAWTPTAAATALSAEIKKISAIGGGAVADDTIHVTAQDSSADVYVVKEIGLYTDGNVLLAIYSQADAIITKGAATVALIAADLVIGGVPAGSVTVGDATFDYPQATETVKGVAEIATTAEAQAGTDDERMLTPAKLQDVTATATRKGVVELATDAETQTGTDTTRAITPANLAARTATETRTGVIELATSAEVQTGTDADRAVTPAGLSARTATTTRTGVVELATDAEVQAGTDATRAVTPSSLNACTASTSRLGVIEIATQTETNTGTDTTRAVTPQALRLYPGSCRAWVNFEQIGAISINSSHGVSSITDLGVGLFAINWDGVFGSSDYAWMGSARLDVDAPDHMTVHAQSSQTKTASTLQLKTSLDDGAARDSPEISVAAFA